MEQPRNFHIRFASSRCPGPSVDRPTRIRRLQQEVETNFVPATTNSLRAAMLRPESHECGTVLVVERDPQIRGLLRFSLQQQGYSVLEASNGSEAMAAAVRSLQVILLDLELEDMDGLTLLQRMRERTSCHIVVLSQTVDEPAKLRAFNLGANDFLGRPFSMAELCARLRVVRRFATPPLPQVFQSGELSVDLANRTVKVSARTIRLTVKEFDLLVLFVLNAGKVLTHAQILREIWGPKMLNRMDCLRVYLKLLREKLELHPAKPRLLLTVRGVGYRLALPQE